MQWPELSSNVNALANEIQENANKIWQLMTQ